MLSALLLGVIHTLSAIPAYRGKIPYRQPDGSVVQVRLNGDEWFHWTTDVSGRTVVRNDDGFLREATVDFSALREQARKERRRAESATAGAWSPWTDLTLGERHIPVLLVEFADKPFSVPDPVVWFDRLLNEKGYRENGATGSVQDYYVDNSQGRFTPVFDVYGPVLLEGNVADYGGTHYNVGACNAIMDAAAYLDDEVDFSQYDSDRDGSVDMILMYFAGFNQAEGGGVYNTDTIWPHQWHVSYGNPAARSTYFDGLLLDTYFCTSELQGYTGTNPCGIGATCHEFAHSLGLPDFYDTDYGASGQTANLMTFSIMAEGAYNNNGRTPPLFNSEELMMLGWMEDQTEIKEPGTLEIGQLNDGTRYEAYKMASSMPGEYFVFECRRKSGWDRYNPGGLLVYHVDKSSRRVGNYTASALWDRWPVSNRINALGSHPCFYIVPASDQGNLNFSGNINAVPFPGMTGATSYLPVDWDGEDAEFRLTDIDYQGSSVSMEVKVAAVSSVGGKVMNTSAKPLRDAEVRLYADDTGQGTPLMQMTTGVDGTYYFEDESLMDRDVVLTVSCEGYISVRETISIGRRPVVKDLYLYKEGQSEEEGNLMRYDPAITATSTLTNRTTEQAAGIHYSAVELGAFVGKQVKTISFQVAGDADDTVDNAYVFLESGKNRIFTQEVGPVRPGEMVKVNVVTQEYLIPEGQDLYIGYGLVNSSASQPILVQECATEDVGYIGQFTQKKMSWSVMTYSGVSYTPILSATLGDPVMPELGFNHIANPGNGTYRAGDLFALSLVRYEDDAPSSVSWAFDGEDVRADAVTLWAGRHTVEARLTYPDGSREVIRLVIQAE